MQLTSNIINTAGLNMSQMRFVNTRPCTSNIAQASDVAAKIEFVTLAGWAGGVRIREKKGREAGSLRWREAGEKFKKASFRYLLLLTSSQRNEPNNVPWLPFNVFRGLTQNFIHEKSQKTKIRTRDKKKKKTALLPVKLETFPSRLHHRTWMR